MNQPARQRESVNPRFTIVVAIDFSTFSGRALGQAVDLAGRHRAVDLHLLHVIDSSATPWSTLGEDARRVEAELAKQKLCDLVNAEVLGQSESDAALAAGSLAVHVRLGDPAEEIVRFARQAGADLVVVGTCGRQGLRRALLGSVAEKVVHAASGPVLVVREGSPAEQMAMPEPTCPECLARRGGDVGRQWWCETHAREHIHPHAYVHSTIFDRPNKTLTFGA